MVFLVCKSACQYRIDHANTNSSKNTKHLSCYWDQKLIFGLFQPATVNLTKDTSLGFYSSEIDICERWTCERGFWGGCLWGNPSTSAWECRSAAWTTCSLFPLKGPTVERTAAKAFIVARLALPDQCGMLASYCWKNLAGGESTSEEMSALKTVSGLGLTLSHSILKHCNV